MIDMDMKFIGPVVGVCAQCLSPIHAGPNEYSVVYSCSHRIPLMYASTDAAPSEGEKE